MRRLGAPSFANTSLFIAVVEVDGVCWFRNLSNVSTGAPLVVRPVIIETISLGLT
jgi:hypothetical protein